MDQLAFTISELFSWFRQPLETDLQPHATNIEISSLLICPQNQLITESGKCQNKGNTSGLLGQQVVSTAANLYH